MIEASMYRPPARSTADPILALVAGETALQSAKATSADVCAMAAATDRASASASDGTTIESTRSARSTSSARVPASAIPAASLRPRVRSLRPSRQVMTR